MHLGWRLTKHAVRMILSNFPAALRISLPLILVMVIWSVLFTPSDPGFAIEIQKQPGTFLALLAAMYFAGIWVAVAWHRFCLLEEYPGAVLPSFSGARSAAYFGRVLLIGLVAIFLSTLLIGIIYALSMMGIAANQPFGLAVLVIGGLLMVWGLQRISLILPAAALGTPLSMGESWDATRSVATAILVLFVFIFVIGFLFGFVSGYVGVFSPIAGKGLNVVMQWVNTMIALSVLTTLYGYCVEQRELE